MKKPVRWCALASLAMLGCVRAGAPPAPPVAVEPVASKAAPTPKSPDTISPPVVASPFPVPAPNVLTPLAGSPTVSELSAARLERGTCEGSKESLYRRARPLIEQMRREVDEAYAEYQARQPDCWEEYRQNEQYWKDLKAYGYGSGGLGLSGIGEGGGGRGEGIGLGSVGTLGHGAGAGAVQTAKSYSRTNTQLVTVDEPDLVKTDGRYLYLTLNGALRIVEALKPRVLSVTKLPGKVRDLFVEGDRAVVYSSENGNGAAECKYAYDCQFMGDGSSTRVSVLDVSDRRHPKLLREVRMSGSLLAARRIGNAVHTVVSDGDADEAPYQAWPEDMPECGVRDSAVRARVKRLKERNESAILKHFSAWAPTVSDGEKQLSLCDNVWRGKVDDGDAFTTLVSFDLAHADKPLVTTSLRSRPGAVFASEDALYVSVAHQRAAYGRNRFRGFGAAATEVSEIHKFRIGASPEQTRYVGSGMVPGHVLNQFSLDQWYGYLRVATSRGRVPDPNVESAVSVLAEEPSGSLVRVGAVEHIAPGEDVRAVRFDNERGYVVTFKKTDPLFVLDLLQPSRPKILGELKIPGFSTYLQRIDAEHLISIGFDANDHGSFAYFDGLLLQLFDVRSPTDPKLLFREKIGTRGSASEAATDHLAFNYFGERGLLAVPATVCEGGGDGSHGTLAFSGLLVYGVDVKSGFKRLGGVNHGERGADCQGWWSRSASAVKRSVFLDELVYSVATDRVKAQLLGRLGTDIADLAMQP